MAAIQLGVGSDIDDLSLDDLAKGTTTLVNSSLIRIAASDGLTYEFSGVNLAQSGGAFTGSVVGFTGSSSGQALLSFTGLALSATTVFQFIAAGDTSGFIAALTSGSDSVTGTAQGDVFRSGTGDDLFSGGGGLDIFDGGAGVDTLMLHGARANYTITGAASRLQIIDNRINGTDGTAILFNVERAQFSDGAVDLTKIDAGAVAAFTGILRSPDGAVGAGIQVGNNLLTAQGAVQADILAAQATSSVATLSYEFFTGKAPSAAGMDFLVSPTGPNPNNLNSAYFQSFSQENRYINFAVNLGKAGDGQAAFTANYGALSLFDATRKAYATIFGDTPSDTKLHAILDPTVQVGGQTITRTDYFAIYGGDGPNGIGTKAAMVGFLLAQAESADLGTYAKSNDAFLTDVGLHNAPFGVDLVGVYSQPGFVFHPG